MHTKVTLTVHNHKTNSTGYWVHFSDYRQTYIWKPECRIEDSTLLFAVQADAFVVFHRLPVASPGQIWQLSGCNADSDDDDFTRLVQLDLGRSFQGWRWNLRAEEEKVAYLRITIIQFPRYMFVIEV